MPIKPGILVALIAICGLGCEQKAATPPTTTTTTANINNTIGYGILNRLKGIWNGPVTSTTPLGGYPQWIVDFRPISNNQVSAKNELDTVNNIFMSFFIVKYGNQYEVAFRNGGEFSGSERVSYFLVDSVSETSNNAFYRFAEINIGLKRAYTDIIFRSDSLYIYTYTNKNNTEPTPTPHMTWSAKLQDTTSCMPAVAKFNFPQKAMTKDFTSTFIGLLQSIYFSVSGTPAGDPYPDTTQPYLGKTTASFTFAPSYSPNPAKNVFLMITTQPLISGFSLNTANLIYRSRYVILSAGDNSYTFTLMHPGTYYYYALYDSLGTGTFSPGDWVSTSNTTFTLPAMGTATVTTQINYTLP